MFFGIVALLVGCTGNRFPDPYAGFEHAAQEQGYWKEVTPDEENIKELHLHTKGISITYMPFETYKDYWGTYSLTDDRNQIQIVIEGGNTLPGFDEATGNFVEERSNEIRITGIRLDSRRPSKTDFRFERFRIRTTQQDAGGKSD